jgi:hypothetical protein
LLVAGLGAGCASEPDQEPDQTVAKAAKKEDSPQPQGVAKSEGAPYDRYRQESMATGYQQGRPIGDVQRSGDTQVIKQSIGRNEDKGPRFSDRLPAFVLEDPRGQRHSRDEIMGKDGVVVVATSPLLGSSGDAWIDVLNKTAPTGARVVVIQDLGTGAVRDLSIQKLRKEYAEDGKTMVLIDDGGMVRRELGVPVGRTVVLSYDSMGDLVHSDQGTASKDRARDAWTASTSAPRGGGPLR